MSSSMNRRHWLRSSALLASGVALAPALTPLEARTLRDTRSTLWERNLRFPPDFSKMTVRLLANENPYGPSDKTKQAIMESVSMGNRYGHMDAMKLKKILAEKEGVSPEHIMLGPGSTDLLEKVAIVMCGKGGNIVSADPSYMAIMKTAMAVGTDWNPVPLTSDYAHDLDGMKEAANKKTKLVYVCNPNNPTGTLTNADKLRAFCAEMSTKVPVFVDEAYIEFLENGQASSMVDLVAQGKDIIISRTFSKIHGMAGLRVGYLVALPETLAPIRELVRSNMGLSLTSLRGALASVEDVAFQEKSRSLNTAAREYVCEELKKMEIPYIPSYTSFMMFPLQMAGETYLEQMFDKGVGIRVFEIDEKPWCRVSMGTLEEMQTFISTLKGVIG